MQSFLLSNNFDANTAEELKKKEIDGDSLLSILKNPQLVEIQLKLLAITPGKLLALIGLVQSYISGNLEEPKTTGVYVNQIPRPFGVSPGRDIVYVNSACLPSECSAYDLKPAKEYKSGQNGFLEGLEKFEIFFIRHLAKFACACINQRCNGTIYFGVEDNKVRYYQ